ncbi:MAG: hypothetical protein ACSLFD_12450 [Solirubrobacterales bacterium]
MDSTERGRVVVFRNGDRPHLRRRPEPVWTSRLLDELRRPEAQATFFLIAPRAVRHGGEILTMLATFGLAGLDAIAQVGLGSRQNRHRSLRAGPTE